MRLHMEADFTPLQQRCPDASKQLCDLIDCCLQRNPDDRPTADEVAQALRGRMSLNRRQPTKIFALIMVLVLAMALIATAVWFTLFTDTPRQGSTEVVLAQASEGLEYRLTSDEEWTTWPSDGIRMAPGQTLLALRQIRDGVHYQWQQAVSIANETAIRLDPSLQPITVNPVTVDMPAQSSGIIIVNGAHFGEDDQIFASASRGLSTCPLGPTSWHVLASQSSYQHQRQPPCR